MLLRLGLGSGLYFWLARGKTHRFELGQHGGHTAGAINRHLQTAFIALGTDAPDLARSHGHLLGGHGKRGLFVQGVYRILAVPFLIPARGSRDGRDKPFG